MTKRKIVLLSLIALFAIIYIIQITQGAQSAVKNITLDTDITGIRLTQATGETIAFSKQVIPATDTVESQERWILEDGREVEGFPLTRMMGQLKDIRVLGTITSASNAERYDLQEGAALVVEALNGQEVLRTLAVGKASTTTSQTYAIIDNANDVVLVSGDLNDVFGKTIDELLVAEEVEGN